jgi:hypothetical protein
VRLAISGQSFTAGFEIGCKISLSRMLYESESAKLVSGTLAVSTTTPQSRVGTRYGRASGAGSPHIPRIPRAGATLDDIPSSGCASMIAQTRSVELFLV